MPRQAPAKRQAAARSKIRAEYLKEVEELQVPSETEDEAQLDRIEQEWMRLLERVSPEKHFGTLLRFLAITELENDRLSIEIEKLERVRLSLKRFLSLRQIDSQMGVNLLSPVFAKRFSPLVANVIAAAAAADRSVRSSRSATKGHATAQDIKANAVNWLERNSNLSISQQTSRLLELFPNVSERTLKNYVTAWRRLRKGIP